MALQSDGKIVVAGYSSIGSSKNDFVLVRYLGDPVVDEGFDPNLNDPLTGAALQPDGRMILNGTFTTVGGVARNHLARLNTTGVAVRGFNPMRMQMSMRRPSSLAEKW